MSTLITSLGSVITGVVGWGSSVLGMFTASGNEVLLIGLGVTLAAAAAGFVKRFLP